MKKHLMTTWYRSLALCVLLGGAAEAAKKEELGGILKLTRWRPAEGSKPRAGKETTVELKLKVMGAYAETAPYDCPKTDDYVLPAIREYALKTAMGQSSGGTWGHGFAWTSKLPKDPTAHPPG